MAVVKFPCSLCQKLMAVGPELLGRRVRCPHCHQVVVAPAAASVADPEDPFQFTKTADEHDSIFGEPADDDLFGTPSKPLLDAPPPARSDPAPAGGNPFVAQTSAWAAPREAPGELAEGRERSPSGGRRSDVAEGGSPNWLLAILVPYALFMTVMAIWYYVKYSSAVQEHPLEQIPDLLGEFQQKQTKTGTQSRQLPKPDQDLPDKLVTTLGHPLRVGAIEVTPLSIEYRPWTAFVKEKGRPEPAKRPIGKTLVLHLRLKNVSSDLTFYPTDPYFDRRPKDASEKPYTLVDAGGKKYFGGVIEYITEAGSTERTWLDGRENDNLPLGPGESRETVMLTYPKNGVFEAVQKAGGHAVWRVQVRRGLVPYQGTEIPASAVVGVAFTVADVKKSG